MGLTESIGKHRDRVKQISDSVRGKSHRSGRDMSS